ncbi:MAG: YihA family ribosome biogenesis GTP-binding protein [Clostridia bacterium]|nr:YihA family ribosome biogenesis GTP-binding protein [Oscillospiraceae bacterium]MBQ3524134.1 YihA family ribosome biogenesis GTP-binding protein [Clostridia bacterium]
MRYDKAEFKAAYGTFGQLPPSDLPEIAFAGRSNVGKSSLLNKLFGRKNLARVSSVPGKTITINFYQVDEYNFVDLPGYGYAKVAKTEKDRWAEMMEGYFNSDRNIKLVVQLVDMRHPPTKDDIMMMEFLQATGYEFIVVMTKADKLKKKKDYNERIEKSKQEMSFVPEERIIPFSSETGAGLDIVKKYIEEYLGE